jgi:hypothetical protein
VRSAVAEERRTAASIRISDAVQTALADARRFSARRPKARSWLEYLGTDPETLPHDE